MIKYELYKIVTKKLFWAVLAVALVINALALFWLNPPPDGLTHAEVKEVYDTIRPMSFKHRLEFLNRYIENNLEPVLTPGLDISQQDETALLQRFARRELANTIILNLTVNTYSAFLDHIDREAEMLLGSAIFGGDPDSFSTRNIIKTQNDFSDKRDIETFYDVNTGINILFDSPSADIIIILLIITIIIALITDEKDRRLFLLVKATPKGHIHTITAKLIASAICVTGVSFLVFLSGLIFTEVTYGLGDIQRSIQSVPELMGSTLRVSVAGFIVLHFVVKTIGLLCITMLIMLIAIHAKHSIIMISTTVLIAAGNMLFAAIPVVSQWNTIRYLNLYSIIAPHRVFGNYFNLDIFRRPVSLMPVFIIFIIILFIILAFTVILSFVKKRGLETNHELFKLNRVNLIPSQLHTSRRYFEFKKIAFVNKALVILVLFGIIQGYTIYNANEIYFSYEHHYIRSTLLRLQGELTEEKEAVLLAEKAKYDYAQSEIDRLTEAFFRNEISLAEFADEAGKHNETIQIMQGFLVVYERYEYVRDNENAQFLYDTGYARLFGLRDPDSGLNAGMRLITVLLLCLCGVFSVEYKTGMYKILNSTIHGNSDTVRLKLFLSVSLTAIAFFLAVLPDLIFIGRFYGYAGITLPLASIFPTAEGQIPAVLGSFPVWSYLVLMLVVRFMIFTGIALIISAFSLKTGSNTHTALAGAGIMLLPLFFHLFGFDLLNPVSLLELVTTNGIIMAPDILKIIQAVVFAGISVISVFYIRRKFGKAL